MNHIWLQIQKHLQISPVWNFNNLIYCFPHHEMTMKWLDHTLKLEEYSINYFSVTKCPIRTTWWWERIPLLTVSLVQFMIWAGCSGPASTVGRKQGKAEIGTDPGHLGPAPGDTSNRRHLASPHSSSTTTLWSCQGVQSAHDLLVSGNTVTASLGCCLG